MGNVKIKRILASAAAAWVACALAVDWTGSAGNYQLDDAANWGSTPKTTDYCYIRSQQAQPLKVGGDGDFFGGSMLRYTGSLRSDRLDLRFRPHRNRQVRVERASCPREAAWRNHHRPLGDYL